MSKEQIYSNNYMALFADGTIGLSDGVGYIDTLSKEEVLALYKAIFYLYNNKENEPKEGLFSNNKK